LFLPSLVFTAMNKQDDIHEFGSCPLRSQRDYGERTARQGTLFDNDIEYILKRLAAFRYGCVYTDGTCLTDMAKIDETDGRDIWIQSPREFWNRGIGMCHDASVLLDAVLRVKGIGHRCCYIYSDEPPFYPTHSFIVMPSIDGRFRILDVFAVDGCVYNESFQSYDKASEWRFESWLETDNGGSRNATILFGDAMPSPKCSLSVFSQNILDKFKAEKSQKQAY